MSCLPRRLLVREERIEIAQQCIERNAISLRDLLQRFRGGLLASRAAADVVRGENPARFGMPGQGVGHDGVGGEHRRDILPIECRP